MQDLSGHKLGQYELRERLGRGGMAEVYKAYQPGLERMVAVKVMLGQLSEDENFVERFRREARAVGSLRHPHIVQVFDFGIEADMYYMVMEYIKGDNLKAVIVGEGKLPLETALRIATQLADALTYAHNAGMIHRDLKPANIMFLDEAHQNAILTDFGIARILGEAGLTGTGMAVGTPDYMSPEAGAGMNTDHRSDIYAMGIILYEMLVGEVPYSADTPLAVIMKHINAPLPTRKDYADAIPESVEHIILRCIAKEPADRYQSAADLKQALDNALSEISSQAVTKPQTAPKQPPIAVSASHENVPTVVEKIDQPTTPVPAAEPTAPPQRNPAMLGAAAVVIVALIAVIAFFALNGRGDGGQEVVLSSTETAAAQAEATEEAATAIKQAPTASEAAATAEQASSATEAATAMSEPTATNAEPGAGEGDIFIGVGDTAFEAQMPPHPDNLALTSNIAPIVDEVELLLVQADQETALNAANAALEENPDDIYALYARAQAYASQWDEDNNALKDANRIKELDDTSPLGYIAEAHAYLDTDYDASARAIEKAYELAPDDINVRWRWAGYSPYEVQMERFDDAEADGARGWQFITLAENLLYEDGDYSRAIPYLTVHVNEGFGDDWEIWQARWMLMGSLLFTEQQAAAYDIAQIFATEAEDAETYANLAYVAYAAGEYEQASTWANTALALDGDSRAASYILALVAWWGDKDIETAIDGLNALEDTEFDSFYLSMRYDHDLNLDRAEIFAAAGRYEEALKFYDAVLLDYDYSDWLYEARANIHLELGDTEAARADLQRARDVTEDDDYRRILLENIIELGPAPTSTPEE